MHLFDFAIIEAVIQRELLILNTGQARKYLIGMHFIYLGLLTFQG